MAAGEGLDRVVTVDGLTLGDRVLDALDQIAGSLADIRQLLDDRLGDELGQLVGVELDPDGPPSGKAW